MRPNPERLPFHHPVDWLTQAQQIYQHELPPFVEKNEGKSKVGVRKVVLIRPIDNRHQGPPVEVEIVYWPWNDQYTFGTMDFGGQRLIVKEDTSTGRFATFGSSRDPNGIFYQPHMVEKWKKHLGDFRELNINPETRHANHVQTHSITPYISSSGKLDGRPIQNSTKDPCTPQLDRRPSESSSISQANRSSAPPTKSDPENASQRWAREQQRSIGAAYNSPSSIPAKARDVQVSPSTAQLGRQDYGRATSEKETAPGPKQDASSPKGREEHSLISPHEFIQMSPSQGGLTKVCPETQKDRRLSSKSKENSVLGSPRQHYAPTERSENREHRRPSLGNNPDVPQAHGPQHQGQLRIEPTSLARPPKRRRQISVSSPLNPKSPQLPTINRSPHPTPSTPSQLASRFSTPPTSAYPQSTDSSTALLSPHKQSRTTLFVAIPLSTDAVPLKLRSCMTLSSLFTSVLAVSAHPATGQDNSIVSGIRATFTWKGEKDVDRAILLKRDFPDCFEVFLEIIDGAPSMVLTQTKTALS
ncbi:hypothetical protein BDR22DRAFT_892999 [Usnea florida]